MNNKYIDNKLKEYDKRFNGILGLFTSNMTVRVGKGEKVEVASVNKSEEIRQFIKEALEQQAEEILRVIESEHMNTTITLDTSYANARVSDKLKSEQDECMCLCHGWHGTTLKSCTHCQKPEEKVKEIL